MIRPLLTAAYLLLLVSLWLLPADARMHYPARGHRIVPGTSSPLDGFTAPSGAYSFRKLRSAYASNAMKLRRTTGGTQDIGFLGCTGFTGCPWNEAAATAFCNATTCFVDTWYDQSGNGQDFVQATTANQPQLIFSCNGALPCVRQAASATIGLFASASVTPGAVVSFSAVARRGAGVTQCNWIRQNGGAGNRITMGAATVWSLNAGASSLTSTAAESVFHAANGVIDGTPSSVFNVDGVETTGLLAINATVSTPGVFGVGTSTCDLEEAVWWNSGLAAGERAALIVNQRSYWSTP